MQLTRQVVPIIDKIADADKKLDELLNIASRKTQLSEVSNLPMSTLSPQNILDKEFSEKAFQKNCKRNR